MRTKDEQKKRALFEATIKLVNEIGFAASSVSKIARQANVSASTIYVFFKSKEDLLVSTYVEIKRDISRAMVDGFDDSLPIRDILRNVWYTLFDYGYENRAYFQFVEQFANSPYTDLVDREALEKHFIPILEVLERGIDQKIIKNVDCHLLHAFLFAPISHLANPRKCFGWALGADGLETAFGMAWDAIKL